MDVDRLSVNDCSASNPETADGYSLTESATKKWDRPVMSNPPKDVTINAVDDSIGCLTKPCGTFCNYIKHGLDIGWRASNYLQNLAGCGLLLQGFSEFLP